MAHYREVQRVKDMSKFNALFLKSFKTFQTFDLKCLEITAKLTLLRNKQTNKIDFQCEELQR